MKIIDGHCDLISKMLLDPNVHMPQLQQANIALQFFAVYIPEKFTQFTFSHILASIDLFYQKILKHPELILIRNREDLAIMMAKQKLGALLTLEGVEGLVGSLTNLRIAYYLGVRSIGITWNNANWAADGVMEPRKGGFTNEGKKLIGECEQLGIILDVSHLSETAFWQLTEISSKSLIASHSNAYDICPHPRNLSNQQITEIIRKEGMIGLTFVPSFIKPKGAQLGDLMKHIDHICGLGGEDHLGFGSDFDGFDKFIPGLEHAGHYKNLCAELYKFYSNGLVEKLLFQNWFHFLERNLISNI